MAGITEIEISVSEDTPAPSRPVEFGEAFRFWLKLGFINFGGPAGQIAIMHTELVDRKRWISEERFLHALSFCMLLPGPEAQQLAVYVGWLLHSAAGGLVAGIFFVLPAFFLIMGLSWIYAAHGSVAWIAAIFLGLRAVVMAIVAAAVLRIGQKALRHPILVGVSVVAFTAIFFLHVPFPLIIGSAGLFGMLGVRFWPEALVAPAHGPAGNKTGGTKDEAAAGDQAARASLRHAAAVLVTGVAVWWAPLLAVGFWRGWDDVLAREALFFSKAAMVTFGGAYAVLAYIAQAAVDHYGWLAPGEMVDGLALAESTPGPLIMVTQFVGFVAAYRNPGGLAPVLAGVLGATVTVWATFAPCFLWIFLGAPFIERLRGHRAIGAALAAITAAVVGVISNLALWFGLHTLFRETSPHSFGWIHAVVPNLGSIDLVALVVAASAFAGLRKFGWSMFAVVLGGAAAGLARFMLGI